MPRSINISASPEKAEQIVYELQKADGIVSNSISAGRPFARKAMS